MSAPTFSIIIPAFNEERFLPLCLAAIEKARVQLGEEIEIIVADNLSTDDTTAVAEAHGAKVVTVSKKVISAVRNGGIAAATGKYLVFVDADDMMSENMLVEVKRVMDSGKYVGGGTPHVLSDRWSVGIALTYALQYFTFPFMGVSLFLFYTTREACNAIGGFNEEMFASEDWDFGFRLKKYGKERKLKYYHMFRASVTKSCRKFDEYGDWFIFLNPIKMIKAIFNDTRATYDLWYRPRR
jgi:glycosyltransferase involved in cell wall biosynthesis